MRLDTAGGSRLSGDGPQGFEQSLGGFERMHVTDAGNVDEAGAGDRSGEPAPLIGGGHAIALAGHHQGRAAHPGTGAGTAVVGGAGGEVGVQRPRP